SIIDAGARRDEAADAAVSISMIANAAGAVWGVQGAPGVERAARATHLGVLASFAATWRHLRGGTRPRSVITRLTDPRPERWGRLEPEEVLAAMGSEPGGLTSALAHARLQA